MSNQGFKQNVKFAQCACDLPPVCPDIFCPLSLFITTLLLCLSLPHPDLPSLSPVALYVPHIIHLFFSFSLWPLFPQPSLQFPISPSLTSASLPSSVSPALSSPLPPNTPGQDRTPRIVNNSLISAPSRHVEGVADNLIYQTAIRM